MAIAPSDSASDRADAAVDTVLRFVNTRFDGKGGRTERFGSVADFTAWAAERGLIGDETVTESEVVAARELRSALLIVLLAHNDHPAATDQRLADAERFLNHAGGLYPVRIALSASGSTVAAQNRGAAVVFGAVLAAANEIVQHDRWARMKGCCSHPCQHAFLDRTKNGAQRFCAPNCASRAAMRAMRERRRDAGDQESGSSDPSPRADPTGRARTEWPDNDDR
jgi:predicted RNA-binding Zn ribbon-like protein